MRDKTFGLLLLCLVLVTLAGVGYGGYRFQRYIDTPTLEELGHDAKMTMKLAKVKAGDIVVLKGADFSSQDANTIGVVRWRSNNGEIGIGTLNGSWTRLHLGYPRGYIVEVIYRSDPRWESMRDRMIFGPKTTSTTQPND